MNGQAARKPLIAIIFALAAITLAAQYYLQGPGWDLIAHYFNGRSLDNPSFYGCLLSQPCGMLNTNASIYFEAYRAPIAGFVIAFINLFAQGYATIIIYIFVLLAAYVLAARFLSKKLGMDSLLLYALLLSPVLLYTMVLSGSEEIVSLIFLLMAIGLLVKKSPWFGLFLGLATLGKYPTLILVPMLLLLVKPKKILYASTLFLLAVAPWLTFNFIFFQNTATPSLSAAFSSYALSLTISNGNKGALSFSGAAYAALLSYAIIFSVVALLAVYKRKREITKSIGRRLKGLPWKAIYNDERLYTYFILSVFLFLALAATLYIGPYFDAFTQMRYGYLLSTSSVLIAAMLVKDARGYTKVNLPILCAAIAIISLASVLVWHSYDTTTTFQLNAYSRVYSDAAGSLAALGYGNCRIVSNDWVYMMYNKAQAVQQFSPNSTVQQYPILEFYNWTATTNISYLKSLRSAKPVFSSYNYSILLPQGYRCYP